MTRTRQDIWKLLGAFALVGLVISSFLPVFGQDEGEIEVLQYGDNGVYIECVLPDPEWKIEVFEGAVKVLCVSSAAALPYEYPTSTPLPPPPVVETIPANEVESDEPDLFESFPPESESTIPERPADEPMIAPNTSEMPITVGEGPEEAYEPTPAPNPYP